MADAARMPASDWPSLGFGAGLRAEHYADVLSAPAQLDWFEAITENYMDSFGRPLHVLESVRRDYPVALHGVALSIGSTDELDRDYLDRLAALAERIQPALITDHLCWCGVDGAVLHDLLPLPYTEEALDHVSERVRIVQDRLKRRILLENPSTYIAFDHSTIDEWTFLSEVAERSDCGILLDVNNIYVSARNLAFDPYAYVDAIPRRRVGQIHLAGFTDMGSYLFDTHSAPVSDDVWDLFRYTSQKLGPVSTLIEWDADIPPFDRLVAEVDRARREAAANSPSATERSNAEPALDPATPGR